MSVTFRIKASEAQGRRLDPEYHHALRRTRIRSTYPSAKLLSLSYFRTGGTPSTAHPEYWNGSIPWVSAKDFKAFRFEDSEDHVTELALAESTTCYVNRPAVLMVSRSGILQHTLPVMVTHKPTTINQDIKAFFPDDRVSVDYLGAFFDVFGSRLLPLVCKSGATVQSLNTEQLMDLSIPLPPLPEQRKIVAELDAAYAAKRAADEKATKLLASIDDMVLNELGISKLPKPDTSLSSRIFIVSAKKVLNDRFDVHYNQNFFRDLADLIWEDKRCCRLGSVGIFVRGVTYKSEDEAECGHAILRANNVSLEEFDIDLSDLVHVSSDLAFSPAQQIKDGDILICAASGSKEHAGKVAYVRNAPDDTYIGGFMMVLRTDAGVNPEYVAAYMQSSIFRGLIFRHLGGTNINNVSLELLNKLPLILPDVAMQDGIALKASSIRAEARKLKADAISALNAAKRKIENSLVNN